MKLGELRDLTLFKDKGSDFFLLLRGDKYNIISHDLYQGIWSSTETVINYEVEIVSTIFCED